MMLQESCRVTLLCFDPPGKGPEPCFPAEMSSHLSGKDSSTLSCFWYFQSLSHLAGDRCGGEKEMAAVWMGGE